MLDEAAGCDVLARVFAARGFSIQRDVTFSEGDVEFVADGWDPDARVGFEYMTHEAGDRRDLTDDELARLGARMEAGELFFFVIDEMEIATADDLEWAANHFLDEVARRRGEAGQ